MLEIRNVPTATRKTSIRLEPLFWVGLEEICARENCSVREIIVEIDEQRAKTAQKRTEAVRAYIFDYFHKASTEEGHRACGHGCSRAGRARRLPDEAERRAA